MASRTLFYRCAAGLDARSVDCWYLVQSDDRTYWVEHAWTHWEEPATPDVGSQTLTVAEVLLTVDDMAVLAGFRAAMEGGESRLSVGA